MTVVSQIPKDLTACPDCDLLLHTDDSDHRQQGLCPRCSAQLWGASSSTADIDLASAISGLLLFIPAVSLPILKLDMVGQLGSNSLAGGVWRLWREDEPLLAILILLCSLFAPLMHLLLTVMIGLTQRFKAHPRHYPMWLKAKVWMQGWSMLEVYAMGIIVAYVKMMDPGEVSVASGTYCLVGLLLCVILCSQYFHEEQAWQYWEQGKSQ
ncbi:paraquat-inducible protein A [Zhongshania guokunii]|uniref:Paraquat-inducible protein A n=1 Tax=Zhongshania guokunii TaxID=641783 RepID=A0ABV3U4Z7_9GAMM